MRLAGELAGSCRVGKREGFDCQVGIFPRLR